MIILLTIIHVIVCMFLIVVVLLQSGKAADLAGAFGGMGSQTTFGPRGSTTVLARATEVAAGLFMLTSLTLAVMQTRNAGTQTNTVFGDQKQTTPKTATPPPSAAPVPLTQPQINIVPEGGGPPIQTIPLNIDPKKGTVTPATPDGKLPVKINPDGSVEPLPATPEKKK